MVRGERANVTGATPTLRAGVIVAANGRVILVDMDHATHVHAPTSVRSLGELLALSMATPVPLRAVWRDDGTAREIWLLAGEVVHARHARQTFEQCLHLAQIDTVGHPVEQQVQ